ncbi:hypothetical protein ScPMuIL_013168 [Solemya velum]
MKRANGFPRCILQGHAPWDEPISQSAQTKRTDLPSGGIRRLPDNFLVSNLNEIVNRRRPSKVPPCEICHTVRSRRNDACSKCIDCSKLLCQVCVDLHTTTKVTQSHSIIDMEDEKDIECKVHQEEIVRFYCEPCDECVCVLCTFQEHRDHEICSLAFSDGFAKHKLALDGMIEQCRGRLGRVQSRMDMISKYQLILKDNRERIRDHAISCIAQVRATEKELLQKVDSYFGKEIIDFLDSKEQLQENYDGLQSACNLADIIIKDKGVEMMILKKELQNRFTSLLEPAIPEMPDGLPKEICFIPGAVKLGDLLIDLPDGPECEMKEKIKIAATLCTQHTQTMHKSLTECSTTMLCDVSLTLCDNALQTDYVQVCSKLSNTDRTKTKDAGVSVCYPSCKYKSTMTDKPECRTCKIQTDTIQLYDNERAGEFEKNSKKRVFCSDVAVNTKRGQVCDKGLQVFCDVGSAESGICVSCCEVLQTQINNHPFVPGTPPVIEDIIVLNTGESDKTWRRKRRSFIHSRRVQTDISMATSDESLAGNLSAASSSERLSEPEYRPSNRRDRHSRRRAPQIRDIGLDPIEALTKPVETREAVTSTEPTPVRHYGVLATPIARVCDTQTPVITTVTRSAATDYTGQKAKSTSTPIVTVIENGTVMPHISFDSKVTWTEPLPTSERTTCTDALETTERGTDMERIVACDQGTSAYPELRTMETNTSSIRNRDQKIQVSAAVCDSGTTPIDTKRSERGTSTAKWEEPEVKRSSMLDTGTGNIGTDSYSMESLLSFASTSEKCDAGTETNIVLLMDKETGTPSVMSRDEWTLTASPQYINTGVSPARPATIETGVGTTEISLMDQATYTEVVTLRDSETETVIVVADNETLTEKIGTVDAQTAVDITTENQETNTETKLFFETGSLTEDDWIKAMFPETSSVCIETDFLETYNKATNTGRIKTREKSTSPDFDTVCEKCRDDKQLVDSGTMPVPKETQEQGIMVLSVGSSHNFTNAETQTHSVRVYDKCIATSGDFDETDMGPFRSIDLCDTATSTESLPYIGLLSELDDVNDLIVFPEMTFDFLRDSDDEPIEMVDNCTSTDDFILESAAQTLISSAYQIDDDIADDSLEDLSSHLRNNLVNIGVNTVPKLTFEKETSTPIRHLFSKGTMTFYTAKSDKATSTGSNTKQLSEKYNTRPSAEKLRTSHKITMTQKAEMKDVSVSTDESLLDEKMVACIAKLRNVSEKLQSPTSKVFPDNVPWKRNDETSMLSEAWKLNTNTTNVGEGESERRKQVLELLAQTKAVLTHKETKEPKVDTTHIRKAQPITTLKVRYPQPAADNDHIKSKSLPRQYTSGDQPATLPLTRQTSPPSRLPILRYNSAPDRIPSQTVSKKPIPVAEKPSKIPVRAETPDPTTKSRRSPLPAINESRTPSICSDSSNASFVSASSQNSIASDRIMDFFITQNKLTPSSACVAIAGLMYKNERGSCKTHENTGTTHST